MKRSCSSFVSVILTLCLLLQCLILPPIFANAETGTPDVTILYEEISLRQEHTKHFVCSDGSYLAISYPEPVHYLDGGEWKDIDNRLFFDDTAGRYVNSENPTSARIAYGVGN